MNKTKKIISLLLSLIMTLSVFNIVPFTAGAAEADIAETGASSGTTGKCTWTLDNGVLTISGNGKMEKYDSTYKNGSFVTTAPWYSYSFTTVVIKPGVTSIGEEAFRGCKQLTSVAIPDSVTSIEYMAFYGCKGLTSVTIPDSVTSIGYGAFSNTTWYNNQPDGLIYAGKVAYEMKGTCPSEVVIKDGTASITASAFRGCTGLKNVTIPDSVTSIGNYAFDGCTGLTSVTIPDSVTSIGRYAFDNTAWYSNQPDGLVYAGKFAYKMKGTCPSEVVIKDGTLGIADSAFSECAELTSVTIPDSVTSIGNWAFEDCTGLMSVTIGSSVTSIVGEAFEGCTGLTNITIPDSVTSIGKRAFGYYYDSGYKKISGFKIYGNKDTEAEKYAKENGFSFIPIIGLCNKCKALIKETNVDVKYDATCSEDGSVYWHCSKCGEVGEFVLPALGHDYKAVVTHPTCTKDGYTTYTCSRCKDTYISDQVNALGHDYQTIVTPPTCTEDGYTTYTCSRCKDTYISDQVNALGHDYQTVDTPPTCTKDGGNAHICSRCKDTYITEQVKALGHDYQQISVTPPTCTVDGYTTYICSRCNDTYVTDEVAALGHDYVLNVKKDPTATLPGIMTAECKRCPEKKNVVLPALNEEDYTLTKTAEPSKMIYTLKDKTYGVYKTVADAPEGWYASGTTGDCTWVKEGSVLTISVTDPSVISPDKSTANYNNTSPAPWKDSDITDVIINEGVTKIGNSAFYECKKLKSVSISDTVTTIGYSAFYDCTSLTDVKMPNSLWSISDSVFNGCTSLKNITIPSSISKIGLFAFARSGLTDITIPESVYSIQDYAFSSCRDLKSITILNPDLSVQKYQTNYTGSQKALGWYYDDYGDYKKIPDFTIYGYKGSNVEKFANNNSFKFIGLDQKTDSATGISVVIPESHNIRVKELTEKNGISAVNDMLYGCKATKAYDIEVTKTIYVVSPDNPSQLVVDKPGNNMQIKIPCADKTATVYRKEKDGGFTKINAIYEKGYMVIYTDRAGTFALTVPCKTALGDVDGNEAVDVKDATWIQRLVAGIEIPFTVDDKYADIDGDGKVTIIDATAIQRYAIRIPVPYPIGQTI